MRGWKAAEIILEELMLKSNSSVVVKVLFVLVGLSFGTGPLSAASWPVVGEIARKTLLSPYLYKLTVSVKTPGLFSYHPGQWAFVALKDRQARAFTMSGAPEGFLNNGEAEFFITRKGALKGPAYQPGSSLSEDIWLANDGEDIFMSGPMGYELHPKEQRPMVFISKGSGVGPHLSVLASAMARSEDMNATLVYLEHPDTIADNLHDQLKDLSDHIPGFRWKSYTRNQFHGAWEEVVREIITLPELADQPDDAEYFICGSGGLRHHMARELQRKGVNLSQIHKGDF